MAYACHRASLFASLLVLLACAGCGRRGVPVTGEITFNGQSVPMGAISFEPADGKGPTTGGRIIDGKYELTGNAAPWPGKKIVRISGIRKTGRKVPLGSPAPPDVMVDEVATFNPAGNNPRDTLTCEVTSQGPNRIDFKLSSP